MRRDTLSKEEADERSDDRYYLGTDLESVDHYWDPFSRSVWQVDDSEISEPQRVEYLGDYVEHVERVADGWAELRYDRRDLATLVSDLVEQREVA